MGITTNTEHQTLGEFNDKPNRKVDPIDPLIKETAERIRDLGIRAAKEMTNKNPADVELIEVQPEVSADGFSNTEYKDEDNINVNQLSKIMVEFQNAMTNDGADKSCYEIFAQIIQGKRFGDILDENGHIKDSSSFSEYDLAKIQELLTEKNLDMSVDDYLKFFDSCVQDCSKDEEGSVTLTHISENMFDNIIEEVVSTDNSYDAFVLKNPDNGNYLIVNSCTNAKSTDDLLAIAYAMSMQLTGSLDLLDFALGYMLPSLDAEVLDGIKSSDLYLKLASGDKEAAKKIEDIYENELKDNQDLIKKYIDKAKEDGTQIELQGYSLGGGIQLTAYSSLCVENPELEDYISSISVFNPYVSFCEENPLNLNENTVGGNGKDGPLIDYLANSDKLRIYSNEEDYVSTFNNSLYKLLDKYCFINSIDLSEHANVTSVPDIYGIVIGGGSNHGFGVIDYSSFLNGDLVVQGTFFAIDESMSTATDSDTYNNHFSSEVEDKIYGDEYRYAIDYRRIIEKTVDIGSVRELVSDNGAAASAFLDGALDYIESNVGNYNYDDFAAALADSSWDAIMAATKEKTAYDGSIGQTIAGWGAPEFIVSAVDDTASKFSEGIGDGLVSFFNSVGNEEAFKNGIKSFLKKDENMKVLMSAINSTLDGDKTKSKMYFNQLLDSLEIEISDSNSELWEDYYVEIGPITIPSPSGYVTITINDFLKEQFVDKLRGVVEEM